MSSLRWVQSGLKVDDKLGYIYQDKSEPAILEALAAAGLADLSFGKGQFETEYEGYGWFGVHPKLEEAYL